MKDIIRTCEPMVRFSKFTYNKKIQEKFEALLPKLEEKKKKKTSIYMSYIIGSKYIPFPWT